VPHFSLSVPGAVFCKKADLALSLGAVTAGVRNGEANQGGAVADVLEKLYRRRLSPTRCKTRIDVIAEIIVEEFSTELPCPIDDFDHLRATRPPA
jgi:hypothetical protein